jgi:hypothetical protein
MRKILLFQINGKNFARTLDSKLWKNYSYQVGLTMRQGTIIGEDMGELIYEQVRERINENRRNRPVAPY